MKLIAFLLLLSSNSLGQISESEWLIKMESHIIRGPQLGTALLQDQDLLKISPEFKLLSKKIDQVTNIMLEHDLSKVTKNASAVQYYREVFNIDLADLQKEAANNYGNYLPEGNQYVKTLNTVDDDAINQIMKRYNFTQQEQAAFLKFQELVDKTDRYAMNYYEASLKDPIKFPPFGSPHFPQELPDVYSKEFNKMATPGSQYVAKQGDKKMIKAFKHVEKKYMRKYTEITKFTPEVYARIRNRPINRVMPFEVIKGKFTTTYAPKAVSETGKNLVKKGVIKAAGKVALSAAAGAVPVVGWAMDAHSAVDGALWLHETHRTDIYNENNFFQLPLNKQSLKRLNDPELDNRIKPFGPLVLRISCEKNNNGGLEKITVKSMPQSSKFYSEEDLQIEEYKFHSNGKPSLVLISTEKTKKPGRSMRVLMEENQPKTFQYFPDGKLATNLNAQELILKSESQLNKFEKEGQIFARHIDKNLPSIMSCCSDPACLKTFQTFSEAYQQYHPRNSEPSSTPAAAK